MAGRGGCRTRAGGRNYVCGDGAPGDGGASDRTAGGQQTHAARGRDRDAGRRRGDGRSRHSGADHGVWRHAHPGHGGVRRLRRHRAVRAGQHELVDAMGAEARHLLHCHRRRQEQQGRGDDRGHAFHHHERGSHPADQRALLPTPGETVGVGMPIIVDFNYDVARSDRVAVEHALEVGSDVPVTGAWFWASDSEVVFRTQSYWPAHEHVLLTAHLTGVPGGPGLWGGSDLSRSFTIGDSHIVKVNLKTDLCPLLYQRVARQEDPGQRRDGRLRLLRQRLLHHQRRSPHHGQLRLGRG